MSGKQLLMALDEVEDGASRGFKVWRRGEMLDGFLVRQGDRVHAYVNSCPHTGAPLDWTPDQFLDLSGRLIQCAIHGARFDIRSGLCVEGPCVNRYLQEIPVVIRNRTVYLADA